MADLEVAQDIETVLSRAYDRLTTKVDPIIKTARGLN